MLNDMDANAAVRERLSALVDGELEGDAAGAVCVEWRDRPDSRAAWHAYQLIGDVLRSDDLAAGPTRDARFLHAFRARLANEPVVLAPRSGPQDPSVTNGVASAERIPAVSGTSRRRAWAPAVAIAAGFMAVAGVASVMQLSSGESDGMRGADVSQARSTSLASQRTAGGFVVAASVSTPAGREPSTGAMEVPVRGAASPVLRDVQLDRYLSAHKQFAGSSALRVTSAFLRNAAAEAPAR